MSEEKEKSDSSTSEEKKENPDAGEEGKKENSAVGEVGEEGKKENSTVGDHCDCGHDHGDGAHNRKRRKRPPPRPSDEDNAPYQPPPPPKLYPPQREPLMEDPLPKWDVPVSKVLEDGKVDCVSTDPGKVLKTIIKAGTDNKQMHINTRVRLHFVGTLDDGTKFGSSRDKNEEFVYLYGKHEVIPGFDAALSTMRNGEIADVVIQPDYGYGGKVFDTIPANSVLHFNIELVSYEWEPIEPMDQIEYAGEKKEEGNEKVKEGKWQEAIDIYQKGYNFVEVLMIGDPGQHKLGQEMKLAIALNKAHCYLKLAQYDEALKMCTDALKVEPASAKAKYRRGLSYMGLKDYYRAESDFRSALVSTPNDRGIKAELARVRAILEPIERAQAQRFKEKNKGKTIFEQMRVEEQREEIARKERELKRIEMEKEQREKELREKELKEKEEKEKELKEKEKGTGTGTETKTDTETESGKEKEEESAGKDGIVKEAENVSKPEEPAKKIEKEDEKEKESI